jgi:peptidoglycan/LPS O-acetylase OafA/YrhL
VDQPPINRIKPIDSLRGIAALGIALFFHFGAYNSRTFSPNPIFDPIYNFGLSFVDLFFVISGFTFCHVYLEKIITSKVAFLDFAWNRVSRLHPLHLSSFLFEFIILTKWFFGTRILL